MPNYRHTFDAGHGVTWHAVDASYVPAGGADELITTGEPAAPAALEARWPGSALGLLRRSLDGAVSSSCLVISRQIAATEAQMAGFQNAAAVVDANGNPPTVEPAASAFAALAASYGMQAAALAKLVSGVRAVSMQLLALQSAATGSAAASADAAGLRLALETFEAGISALVAALNGAGLTTTIAAPPAIVIVGINAPAEPAVAA